MTLQSTLKDPLDNNARKEVANSYSTIETLLHTLKQQETLFIALSLIKEINRLNGYKVITDYHISLIKNHFKAKNEKMKIKESKTENRKTKIEKHENSKTKKRKSEIAKSKYRELQKGYMKLLSN